MSFVWIGLPRKWCGLTLNPYYEDNDAEAMVDDDVFILNTQQRWSFGRDDTGNIMHADNIRHLWVRAQALGPVHLMTGDGSIDCQFDPNEQESIVAPLHFCEAVFALGVLAPGGSMVLKMFTLFEPHSVALFYLLGCAFEELIVTKPVCSKSGNAETYIIGKGFRPPPSPAHLECLLAAVSSDFPKLPDGRSTCLLDPSALPPAFIAEAIACAKYFSSEFARVISRNLDLDENGKGQTQLP